MKISNLIPYAIIICLLGFILYSHWEQVEEVIPVSEFPNCPVVDVTVYDYQTKTIQLEEELGFKIVRPAEVRTPELNQLAELAREAACKLNNEVSYDIVSELRNISEVDATFKLILKVNKNNERESEDIIAQVQIRAGESRIITGSFRGRCQLNHYAELIVEAPSILRNGTTEEKVPRTISAQRLTVQSGRSQIILRSGPVYDKSTIPSDKQYVNPGDVLYFQGIKKDRQTITLSSGEVLEGRFLKVSVPDDPGEYWAFSAFFQCQ